MIQPHDSPYDCPDIGKFLTFRGKYGENRCLLISQSPNRSQTLVPDDLKTLKYSINLPFFQVEWGICGEENLFLSKH